MTQTYSYLDDWTEGANKVLKTMSTGTPGCIQSGDNVYYNIDCHKKNEQR